MSIKDLQPTILWKYFHELTQIPRPSKKEQRVVEYVKNFGKEHGLKTIVDEAGNVILKKPATKGMEKLKGVILQCHLDMVPQKNSNVDHNFEKDPVEAYVDGEWVTAKGTTLGADNGIGVAAALAIMESGEIVHGPLEALLTVDEETGMTGAFGLKAGLLDGDILINLDSEEDGELYVGCAGGMDANIKFSFSEEPVPDDAVPYNIKVSGLKGGHSGMDIHLGRGNSNKLLFRFMKYAYAEYGIRIASVDGGGMRNAIPREAEAVVVVPVSKAKDFEKSVREHQSVYKKELANVEPDLSFTVEKTDMPVWLIDAETGEKLIHSVCGCPNGVIRMSDSIPGLVETSTNLASVRSFENEITIQCLMRSSVDTAKDELAGMIESVFKLAGAEVHFDGAYPGWKPNMDSEILKIMNNVYKEMYGESPEVKAVHAGLECGLLGGIYPHIDMISFGPEIVNPHSPDEKVHIESVEKFWNYLLETLKNMPVK